MTNSTNRILLLGADGQVGWELRRALLCIGEITACNRHHCDLYDLEKVQRTIEQNQPDIIVNAAAYTQVDQAENEAEQAMALNRDLPRLLGESAVKSGALVVDYSTDYVFDGTGEIPYKESAPTAPVNAYGASKLAGLEALTASGCRHLVFRVSWVYSTRRTNFVKTMLRLAKERDSLQVVNDQVGSPTPADLIADITAQCLMQLQHGRGQEGIFHLAPEGETSWHGFATAIIEQALGSGETLKARPEAIAAVPTSTYPTPAKRPANSRLDTSLLKSTFGLHLPHWRQPLDYLLRELLCM